MGFRYLHIAALSFVCQNLRDCAAFGQLCQQVVYRQQRLRSNQTHACSVATPLPLIRFLDHSRTRGIEHNVTCEFHQIGVAVHRDGLEMSLKQVTHSMVAAVTRLGKHAVVLARWLVT
jgi:hypothetical protein